MSQAASPDALAAFFRLVGRLKVVRRQGWVDRKIPTPESVAEHSYRVAIMTWVLSHDTGLDTERLLKLVLVHDLPEAIAGDATPYGPLVATGLAASEAAARWRELIDGATLAQAREDKNRAEGAAVTELASYLDPELGSELAVLWAEYADRGTPEAQFVSEVDKLEALFQAIEYRAAGHASDVENFLTTARETVQHPALVPLLESLERLVTKEVDASS